MAYTVNYTNPVTTPITITATTVDTTSTSLALLGQNYDNYGELVAENFLKLLENFSYTTAPSNPIPGQLWHNTTTKILNVRDASGLWKPIATVYTGTDVSPPILSSQATGDLYTNTATGQIYVYNGSAWTELANTNTMLPNTRLDTLSASHSTIEAMIGTTTIFIVSLEDDWVPKSTELLADSSLMNASFPTMNKGINFNITGNIAGIGYGVHGLAESTIDVGRGKVKVENNSADNADGAGITLKTTSNPTTGSIFSIRNSSNAAKLWAGEAFSSSGVNGFYIGSTTSGSESNPALYNIKLTSDGDVSALTASGSWLATNIEAVNNGLSNKLITPSSLRYATDIRVAQLISDDALLRATAAEAAAGTVNDQIMTPLRTKESIIALAPAVITTQVNALMQSSLTTNGYQKFASGLIWQWGQATVGGQTSVTVTYPIPFTTAVYSIVSTPNKTSAGGGDNDYWAVNSATLTTFAQTNMYDGSQPFYWMAIGK